MTIRNPNIRSHLTFLLKMFGVVAIFTLLAYLDHIYLAHSNAVRYFEPEIGLALALLLIGGKRYAWGVFLGSLLGNAMHDPYMRAVAISSGDTLGALCGAWLLTRDSRFDRAIRSLGDYLRLIFMGGCVGGSIGALTGATALLAFGLIVPEKYFFELIHWWMGSMLGVLLVAPLILSCWKTKHSYENPTIKVFEAVLLLGLTFVAGQIIFLGWFHTTYGLVEQIAKAYWMFMFIAWVAVRLGIRATMIAVNLTAVQALLGAYRGVGFFANDLAQTHLTNYWFYVVILSVVGMALATYFSERRLNEEVLRRSETRLRTLYDSTSDAVMLLSEKGFFDCNKAALAMFGCATKEEFCTKHPADISPPKQPSGMDSLTLANRQITTAIENGSNYFEWIHRRVDTGKAFPADVLLNSMELEGKTVLQATVRDITLRKQSEEALNQFKYTLDQTLDSIFMFRENDFRFVYVNEGAVKQVGYTRDELLEMTPLDIKPEFTRARFQEMVQPLRDGTQTSLSFETVHRHKDGHDLPVEIFLQLVRKEGAAPRFMAIVRDITQRKNNEARIERLSSAYRLLSQVNEAIVRAHDEQGLFAAICNAAVESGLFRFAWVGVLDERSCVIPVASAGVEDGYTAGLNIRLDDERTGKGPTATVLRTGRYFVCQDIANDPGMATWRDDAIRRGYRSSAAFPILRAGNVVGTVNVYAVEAHFFTPGIIRLMQELAADVSFALDVFTERKRREQAEEENRQLNASLEIRILDRTRQLEAVNGELEAFSYSVSHDLRAPLRSIDGFSKVLMNTYHDRLDATGQDWLERVRRASQHMGCLIDDMLQLSQVTRGALRQEPVDLGEIAETVAGALKKTSPERQVRFIIQHGLTVQADPGLLRIVMDNLLGNAWKFTGKKTGAEIEFGARGIDGEQVFFVRDNGAGFSMNYAHKLFGPFQRLHGMGEFEGTGIGLATVQRIIQRHNGKVWAEAKEGEGATFYFTLPQRETRRNNGQ